jgi:hypothetical protein
MKTVKINKETFIDRTIDKDTGELLDVNVSRKHDLLVVSSKEQFFYTYHSLIGLINGLDGSAIKLLQWISMNAQYNTNMVSLSKSVCELIKRDIGLSYQTVRNIVVRLKKENVLIPMGGKDATYRINPKFFWKGEMNERLKTMKYILEIECPECL